MSRRKMRMAPRHKYGYTSLVLMALTIVLFLIHLLLQSDLLAYAENLSALLAPAPLAYAFGRSCVHKL